MIEVPDVSDPDVFESGFPHEIFRQLRREAPVYWHEGDYQGGRGYWIISRYETIKTISRQPMLFSSASGTSIEDRGDSFVSMIGMDPPDHRRYRALVSGGFTPRQISDQEPHHREIVKSILDSVVDRGQCDFVVDVSAELPLRVIAELLGVPQSACHDIFDWSNRMIGSQDPEYVVSEREAGNAAQEMFVFANGLAEDRLKNRRDDLMSTILHGEVDGSRLDTLEFDSFFLLLAVAGNETTRNLISHGLLLLLEHPEDLVRLREDPSLLPAAIEEMLRFKSPVYYMRRTATEDTELGDQRIRKGDKLMLYYPSANRDEDAFDRPDAFDIDRKNNHHLAFGVGEHFCVGTHLARLETRVMFEGILERMHDMELAGPIATLRSNLIDGIKHIPLKFTAASS
ncbi:MAG: cytochrome P450 [Myxococcales bacterium]|nr:cytochrome P450 [Myxococcales bacterium]